MVKPSTFSIVAYDPEENACGVATASKFLAVGAVVSWARAGAGAVATQSYANTTFGPKGLDLMDLGVSAQDTLRCLLENDPEAKLRQVGLVDCKGGSATFTGEGCHDWAGGVTGENYAAQGNILVGPQVIHAMEEAFITSKGNLVWRLYAALLAGDQAGGDRRGRQSAAIYVVKPEGGYAGFNDRWVDLRVDDDPDPVKRLGDLLELRELYFGESPPEEKVQLVGKPLQDVQRIMAELGYYSGEISGSYDQETQKAMEDFIGCENFEDRTDCETGIIDLPVLEYIMKRFGKNG